MSNSNPVNQIARQIYAMSKKKKDVDIVSAMHNERYQRTMTDEYPFRRASRPGFKPVSAEQKAMWKAAAKRGGD